MSNIAVMQPYIFPYIGYFQMISTVDKFVFYDDVNYIKGGWINRNRILINNLPQYFTIPLIKASPNRLINEIEFDTSNKDYSKLTQKIQQTYRKAPYFKEVFPIIEDILNHKTTYISELAIYSVITICQYLDIDTKFFVSSKDFNESKGIDRADRLIDICKKENCDTYINAIGGQELYSKEYFSESGIKLFFIESEKITYKQFGDEFCPWLSIIDVLMFNEKEEIKQMLNKHKLI